MRSQYLLRSVTALEHAAWLHEGENARDLVHLGLAVVHHTVNDDINGLAGGEEEVVSGTVLQLPGKVPVRHVRQLLHTLLEESRLQLLVQRVHAHANGAAGAGIACLQRLLGKRAKKRRLAAAPIPEEQNFHTFQWLCILGLLEEVENGARAFLHDAWRGELDGGAA